MAEVIKISSAPSVPRGPKVPVAYTRTRKGQDAPGTSRDRAGTRSMDRENGSVSGDYPLLSEAALRRVEKAGMLVAAGAVVALSIYGLSHAHTPHVEQKNPSGIPTSGAESE